MKTAGSQAYLNEAESMGEEYNEKHDEKTLNPKGRKHLMS
jgi:hypothetical protein